METREQPEIRFGIHLSDRRLTDAERAAVMADPGFGSVFTDHMVTLRWTGERGWHDGRLEPYGPITLDPAASVLHYGQEIFEGLKAYAQENGEIATFRPYANAARMNRSAQRMAMAQLPEQAFVDAIDTLLAHDRAWVPTEPGRALYIRPFLIATQTGLGVNSPSDSYLFTVIASPVGGYFTGGVRPVTVWLSREFTRAAPGGTGEAKCGGNYAAAFAGQAEATRNGCDQVVWLDSAEHRWVEEMGGMNLFFVHGSGADARIVTPALTGTLLPGVTRDSLLQLGPDLGVPATEGRISVDDWQEGCASGEITEVFACGTAAVITPVGAVKSHAGNWVVGDGTPGPVTMRLRQELVDIQYGHRPDPYGWMHKAS